MFILAVNKTLVIPDIHLRMFRPTSRTDVAGQLNSKHTSDLYDSLVSTHKQPSYSLPMPEA